MRLEQHNASARVIAGAILPDSATATQSMAETDSAQYGPSAQVPSSTMAAPAAVNFSAAQERSTSGPWPSTKNGAEIQPSHSAQRGAPAQRPASPTTTSPTSQEWNTSLPMASEKLDAKSQHNPVEQHGTSTHNRSPSSTASSTAQERSTLPLVASVLHGVVPAENSLHSSSSHASWKLTVKNAPRTAQPPQQQSVATNGSNSQHFVPKRWRGNGNSSSSSIAHQNYDNMQDEDDNGDGDTETEHEEDRLSDDTDTREMATGMEEDEANDMHKQTEYMQDHDDIDHSTLNGNGDIDHSTLNGNGDIDHSTLNGNITTANSVRGRGRGRGAGRGRGRGRGRGAGIKRKLPLSDSSTTASKKISSTRYTVHFVQHQIHTRSHSLVPSSA
jgi:hypothetical protein